MDDIKTKEKNLFDKWAQSLHLSTQDFCPNGGLLFRGDFYLNEPDENGIYTWGRKPGDENRLWCNSCKRLMILTKDLNDNELWDIRQESGGRFPMPVKLIPQEKELQYKGVSFYRRLNRWVFGIYKENHGIYPQFKDVQDYNIVGRFYETTPLVRINCKRENGKSSVSNNELKRAMWVDKEFLIEQLRLYRANIILCCGCSDNIIPNFVKKNYLNDLDVIEGTGDWIYFSEKEMIIVINSYHPSISYHPLIKINDKWLYDEFMKNFAIGIAKSKIEFKPI